MLLCEWCGEKVPYTFDEDENCEVVIPAYEWQGNAFCAKCYDEILRVNPHVVYPEIREAEQVKQFIMEIGGFCTTPRKGALRESSEIPF